MIAEMQKRARSAGVSMRRVCEIAGVHPTTFSRWKISAQNQTPVGATLATLSKLESALSALEAERAAA